MRPIGGAASSAQPAGVFERTGDIGSATTKMIAQEAGINEAILYRHFGSKEEIFYTSVVEPLYLPIDALSCEPSRPRSE